MKAKDLLTMTTAALGTATLTVAAFWAGPIDAGNDADPPPPKVAKARLVSHGVELTLSPAGGRTFQAGDQPEFELTALNTTGQAAGVGLDVTMTASSPRDAMSRTVRLPSPLWQCQQFVELKPRETKVLALCASTNLPAHSVITVSLREPAPPPGRVWLDITALTFSTGAPKAAPLVASTR